MNPTMKKPPKLGCNDSILCNLEYVLPENDEDELSDDFDWVRDEK